jgi:hypothetical protein
MNPKETVIVFEGEELFIRPRTRTYDMEKGVSQFVGSDGTVDCATYVVVGIAGGGGGTWSGVLCSTSGTAGKPVSGAVEAGKSMVTPCLVVGSLVLNGANSVTATPCGTSVTPVYDDTTTTTTTSTTTTTTTQAPSTTVTATTTVTPVMGGGGGGGMGGGEEAAPEPEKKKNWWWLLLAAGAVYLFTKKKKS